MPEATATHRPWLRAMGKEEMPLEIELEDGIYAHQRTFKHDFFAATGLYLGPSGRAVLKVGRQVSLFGLPLTWIGRWLAGRERRLYELVDDLEGVPRCMGTWGRTGFVHAFVEGHPIQKGEHLDDEFFPRLRTLLDELHARDVAYADLEKRENILVDAQGGPSLIDFQISWHWPAERSARSRAARLLPDFVGRWLLARLQEADLYHLRKHVRRLRPDLMSVEEIEASRRPSADIRWHRRLSRPLQLVRRGMLRVFTGSSRSPKQDGAEFLDNLGREVPGEGEGRS